MARLAAAMLDTGAVGSTRTGRPSSPMHVSIIVMNARDRAHVTGKRNPADETPAGFVIRVSARWGFEPERLLDLARVQVREDDDRHDHGT